MSRARTTIVLALVLGGAGVLSGCAAYDAWRKCGSGCPGDAQLAAAVRARLDQHTELLAPNQVYVSAIDGVVYLSGQVFTELQRDTAESVALQTPGAPRVVSLISVENLGR
jgi:BON domain-containing protein